MTGAVCYVRSSGLVKSGWYLYLFWPNSRLITCLQANIFTECSKRSGTRRIFPCKHGGSGLICSALDRELEPGEAEQDPNKGKKWKFNNLMLETFWVISAGSYIFNTLAASAFLWRRPRISILSLPVLRNIAVRPVDQQHRCPCVSLKLYPSCLHICILFWINAPFNFPQFPLVFQLSCIKKD